MKKILRVFLCFAILVGSGSCVSIPPGAAAIQQFETSKYLGKWYEIARIDFIFEKDLNNTSAEYGRRTDGQISVTNRGFNTVKGIWQESLGTARFRTVKENGELEVSFFPPFFSAYNIIAIDVDYQYALIAGDSLQYLWILSRTKTIPESVKNEYVRMAASIGYNTASLIWVHHN